MSRGLSLTGATPTAIWPFYLSALEQAIHESDNSAMERDQMTLTAEQLDAAAAGENVHFTANGVEFVIVRSEVFERVKPLLEQDHDDLRMILGRSSEGNGWDEPGMEAYDSYPAKS